jgi:phosphonopyruvate decarboxylase
MAIVGSQAPGNYVHVVFNNGAHDSVGGQPTVGLDIDLPTIAKAAGYKQVVSVSSKEELERCLDYARHDKVGGNFSPLLLEIRVQKGNRKDLGRPTTTPIENKEALMDFLKQ